ncbi:MULTISPECIES: sensor histidine kinase [Anaerolinea]|uniref:histidine kinase n=1 Tax=Anaerolinea thermophila (strain DSM 14523 / JCM 11388 / NBRC 100420 / UNI-1) TaxID=926569 RepID=E8N4J8_ANATU|nr:MULTISPECIES: ATP-binding protein [Anaerolinea]BAJ63362.1 putative two-component sensor histidine kinase [Anaerolinea thermophila UNI-1]
MLEPLLPDFRVRQRDYLLEIARALTQELDLKKLLGRILRIAIEMLAGQAGLIALREEEGGWRVVVTQGIPMAFLRAIENVLANVPADEDPERYELPEINRQVNELAQAASMGLLHGIVLPLITLQRVVGLIVIFRSYAGSFTSNDIALLSSFADQAAIAVQNAQLYTQTNLEKERLNALLDSLADGILILRPDHSIERCNPAISRMLNLPLENIRGRRHDEIIRWSKPPQGITLEQAESDGWPLTPHAYLYVEGDLSRSGLAPLPVGITYAPLISSENKLVNIIATVRDITRFRQAEELKSTFISIVSHELKTPVALIKGYVSTLRREDASWDPEIIQDSLKVIEEEADRLAVMIENLLDASRLQAGGLTLKKSDLSLPELARRVAQRMQTQTSSHRIVVDFPDDFPIVLADEGRLQQVLTNLIGNAIKYAPGGEIRVHGEARGNQIIVCVSDQGPGINPEDVPHVFDRFYRNPEAAKKTKGAGLGLYLSRAIIEAHGGRIWVDSHPGQQGARICFTLPRD